MIKVILLDADGVLIRDRMFSHHLEEKYGISKQLTIDFYHGPFTDCIIGKKDMRELLPKYLKQWGWPGTLDQFIDEWFKYEHALDDDLVEYMSRLRARGIRCFVATNQEKHRAQYMLEKMGFADHFDGMFVSAHLGYRKPAYEYFESVMKKLPGIEKDEVLFWDDTQDHIAAARAFGINAELYTDFANFSQKMSDYQLK